MRQENVQQMTAVLSRTLNVLSEIVIVQNLLKLDCSSQQPMSFKKCQKRLKSPQVVRWGQCGVIWLNCEVSR